MPETMKKEGEAGDLEEGRPQLRKTLSKKRTAQRMDSTDSATLSEREVDENTPLLAKVSRTCHMDPDTVKWCYIGFALFLLIGSGVCMGMYVEGWRFLTSLYVVVQLITTIGYGDFAITHNSMRLFVCAMVLCSLVIVSFVANILGEYLTKKHFDRLAAAVEELESRVRTSGLHSRSISSFAGTNSGRSDDGEESPSDGADPPRHSATFHKAINLIIATVPATTDILFGTLFYGTYEACACGYGRSAIPGCVEDEGYDVCVETGGYVKTYLTAFYMAVITLTTVGIGDFSPRTKLGRAVAVPWILIGVGSMAHWLKELSAFFLETEMAAKELNEDVDRETFNRIDTDGSGTLSRAEYRGFILVKHGFVSQDLLDKIDRNYDKLDLTGDEEVSYDMIQAAQKQQKERQTQAGLARSRLSIF